MRKDKIDKPDGRYIIYYSFDEEELACEEVVSGNHCPVTMSQTVSGQGFPETTDDKEEQG